MEREEAIRRIKAWNLDADDMEVLSEVIPELKESEDERIRKELIELISCMHDADSRKKRWIAYLEKQKERGEAIFREGYLHGFEDAQKEQKPITINQDEKEFLADEITAFLCNYDKEFDGEDPVPSEVAEHFYLLGKQAQEQKPVEWSEDIIRKGIKDVGLTQYQINWLKNNVFPPKKKQEQTEVDLEEEYKTWWKSISGKINVEHIMEWYMHETAHHFYELGLNARKEE